MAELSPASLHLADSASVGLKVKEFLLSQTETGLCEGARQQVSEGRVPKDKRYPKDWSAACNLWGDAANKLHLSSAPKQTVFQVRFVDAGCVI